MKKPRAKPIYAYAIKDRGGINLTSIDESRADVIRRLNRPSGESLIMVRISQVDKYPRSPQDKETAHD